DPPRRLVVQGLYRFTRNPMYVGLVIALLGETLRRWSWHLLAYTAIVAVAFHIRVLVDRKSTRLNSSHLVISYAVFCLKKKHIVSERVEYYLSGAARTRPGGPARPESRLLLCRRSLARTKMFPRCLPRHRRAGPLLPRP